MSYAADSRVARRYAAALFAAARRAGTMDKVQQGLDTLGGLWERTPRLREAMESPLIPGHRKHDLVDRVFAGEIDSLCVRFLHLLIEKRRESIVPQVRQDYARLADVERRLVRATATVALPVDDLQRAALTESLERRTGKSVVLAVEVDPGIIGGVIVRMEDTVIDGSVRGALERLREEMLHER